VTVSLLLARLGDRPAAANASDRAGQRDVADAVKDGGAAGVHIARKADAVALVLVRVPPLPKSSGDGDGCVRSSR